MTVAENLLLQQMQQMSNVMTLPQTGSANKNQSSSFQDMMTQAGKDDAAKEEPAAPEQTVQDKPSEDGEVQKRPASQKDGEDPVKVQEQVGDPNAMQYVMELFRPEIVDVSEPAPETIIVEAPVVETATEAVAVPVESVELPEAVVEEPVGQIPVETVQAEAPQEVELAEGPVVQTQVQETVETPVQQEQRPEEAVRPAEDSQTAPDQAAETVERVAVKEVPESTNEKPEENTQEPQGEAAELGQQPVFQEVEAAPVKVAENYKTVDTEAPEMDEKLAADIHEAVEEGVERIELKLNPANLGQLTIEMTRDSSGVLQVALHVASTKAEGLLSQHLDGLHAALQAYGQGQQVRVEVQRAQEPAEQHNQQQANPDGHNQNHQQRQEQRQERREHTEDFMQRLRLGLFSTGEEA